MSEDELYDPDVWAAGVPHERLARLRQKDPVHWQPLPGGDGYWVLLKHADVMAASRDPQRFSAARGGIVIEDLDEATLEMVRAQLLAMDPPEHGRLRRHVLHAFTPRRIDALEGWLRQRAGRILDDARARGEVEWVDEVASALPVQAVCRIMGVPEEDAPELLRLGDEIIGRDDPALAGPQGAERARQASVELGTYGFQLAHARRAAGGDDLVSSLLDAEIDGTRVGEVEFAGLFVQMIVAGNETTRTLLAQGLLALIEHPDAWTRLRDDPAAIPRAVEELLRWTTPVHYFRRTATCDTEVRGVRIGEGQRVVLLYTSANFDEEVFDEPFRFDVARDPNPHLAFGFGEHHCLGARLARLEARVFFEECCRRFAAVELTGRPVRLRSNLNNALKRLPVRLVPDERAAG